MRRKRDAIPRAKDSWVWLGGIALLGILAAGVVAAAVALWENIDVRQLVPQLAAAPSSPPLPEPPRPAARDSIRFDAVLFDSPRNAAFFPDTSYYRGSLQAWRALVEEVGGEVREATSAADLRALGPGDVLVLAEAPCMSPGEIAAVRAHLRRGGGVVANWAVGARDAECAWRGWQTIRELTGAEDVRELPSRSALFLTVPAGTALSPGLDPGTRVELRPDPSLALRRAGPSVYWSDWALNPAPDESGGGADVAAVATRAPRGGRTAWFGLRIGQAVTSADSLRLQRMLQNGVLWAAGVASAEPAAWPHADRAALVFTLDVEDEAENALQTAALFREEALPVSFFAVSQLVKDDSQLARALIGVGEVGSQTADHTPVAGLTSADQSLRLRRSWDQIADWTGVPPAGLKPPEETFDLNTLAAWRAAGGAYVLAGNDARSASPEMYEVGDGTVVLLPRLLKDDYNIIVQDRVIRSRSMADAYLEGTRKLHAIGGLAVVGGHTQIMRTGPRLNGLRTVADTARAQGDWWIARAEQVAEWWKARAAIRITFVPPDTTVLEGGFTHGPVNDLLVEAPPDRAIENLWVDIVLPVEAAAMFPVVDGASVDFSMTDWGIRVPVEDLPAGATRRISLLVAPEDEGARPGTE